MFSAVIPVYVPSYAAVQRGPRPVVVCIFSRNISWVTLKISYFHSPKTTGSEYPKMNINLILETEALSTTGEHSVQIPRKSSGSMPENANPV